jgi:hypothetical protein
MPKGTSDAGSATHRTPKLEGRVSAPDSAIRRWDRIALLLHYVINPARRLTTNIRRSAPFSWRAVPASARFITA